MPEDTKTPKPPTSTERPRPTYHLVRRDPAGSDALIDFETFTGDLKARRALTDELIDAGWRYIQLEPGQSYAEAMAARS